MQARLMSSRKGATPMHASPARVAPRRVVQIQLQTKLKLGGSTDTLEREADVAAESAMRGKFASPPLSSSGQSAQTKAVNEAVPAGQGGAACPSFGIGAPLPRMLRDYFEPSFGESFSNVRVH